MTKPSAYLPNQQFYLGPRTVNIARGYRRSKGVFLIHIYTLMLGTKKR
jgi:hypothetical protein